MIKIVEESAKYVYKTLGPGHAEAIYRDAMSLELQERGFKVKTEAPISIKFKTKKGKNMIVGSGKVDLFIEKSNKFIVVELKTIGKIIKEEAKTNKEDTREYIQLQKYLSALDINVGILINFPFPPEQEPEIII